MRVEMGETVGVADESAHPASVIEWWFVQGFYEGGTAGCRHFMLSLFRQLLSDRAEAPQDGFYLLASVLDPATGRNEGLSQLDPATVGLLPRMARKVRGGGLSRHVLDAYASEVEAFGPPRPHRCEGAAVELKSGPFQVVWRDFALAQSEGGFALSFVEPDSRRACRFRLQPFRPRLHIRDIHLLGSKTMEYVTYPRLALTGDVAGEAVAGEAWLDHEWGNLGSFVSRAEKRVLGWDWLGVNLEDGTDFLLMLHRDMEDQSVIHQYAVGLVGGRQAVLTHDLSVAPLRHWESPRTHVRYPVALSVCAPELGLELSFEPLVEDQEVAVFGPIRAIWEGAGTVRGTLAGRPVRGRGRLEFHGYGYILDHRAHLDRWAERINGHMADFLPKVLGVADVDRYAGTPHWRRDPSVHTTVLSQPLWDLMLRRGKHWRAMFGILLLEALGKAAAPYEALASITGELAHTGSLIVDDIQDGSPTRRGAESIHLRYGVDVAINAANTAYFLCYLALRDYPHLSDAQRLELYRVASRHFVRAHLGQGQDIYWPRRLTAENLALWMQDSLAPQILQAYADKTAALVEGSAENACIIAGADAPTRDACVAFGRAFGVAFQIVDDVLDFSEARDRAGTGGKDLAEGKVTYVILRAIEALDGPRQARLRDILCSSSVRRCPEGLREGIELVRRSGALAACRQEALAMMEDGWRQLSAQVPPSEPKILLRALCLSLLQADGDTSGHHADACSR